MTSTRGPQRRAEDFEKEVSQWAMMLLVHRGKLLALCGIVISAVTWTATTAGYRYTGPRDDIKHLTAVVDTVRDSLRVGMSGLRAVNVERDLEGDRQRDQLEFLTYLLCARVPANDTYAREKCRLLRLRAAP